MKPCKLPGYLLPRYIYLWDIYNPVIDRYSYRSQWISFSSKQHSTTRNSVNWVLVLIHVTMQFCIMNYKIKNHHNKMSNIFALYTFVFIPRYIVKAVQDDISFKTIRLWLRNAVQLQKFWSSNFCVGFHETIKTTITSF